MVVGGVSKVLAFEGDVDFRLLPQLTASLEMTLKQKPSRVVIDLSRVRYLDCSVVALLMTGMQEAAMYGGKLMLAGAQKNVRRMLESVRLGQYLPIYLNVDEALVAR
jgi:anti-anti-sigma factor